MKRIVFLGATLTACLTMGMIGALFLNAQQEPVKRTVLLRTDLEGIKGKEAVLILGELAPGASSKPQRHSGHELGYILEGSVSLKVKGKPPVILKAGDTFRIQPDQIHSVKNASSTAPAKALVFRIGEKGKTLPDIPTPVR